MKTIIKITTLALITVLAMLACTPEIEVTQRDFKEIRDGKNPKYEGVYSHSHLPTFDAAKIKYSSTLTEEDRELDIYFPDNADILDKEITTAALKTFLSIYTFTTDTSSSETKASVKDTDIDFDFVRRVRYGTDTDEVVISLKTVPDKPFVIKIDATKYTFAKGLKLDTNDNGITGEAIYDDYYDVKQPSGAASSPNFIKPTIAINLNIVADNTNNTNPMAAQDIKIAELAFDPDYNFASLKKYNEDIIKALMPKIKLQKYDPAKKTWTDAGQVKAVDSNTNSTTNGDWYLAVYITPQDGDIYRAYATDMKNLKTTIDILGINQKISVSGGIYYDLDTPSYKNKTVISNPLIFTNPNNIPPKKSSPVDIGYVSSDASGKNVKLEIYFQELPLSTGNPPTTTKHWLSKLDTATFKKNVKLVYDPNYPSEPINDLFYITSYSYEDIYDEDTGELIDVIITPEETTAKRLDDLVFIPIKDVSYDSKNRFGSSTTPGLNRIIITLDPSYQLSQNKNRVISLLLAPGFKYDNDYITFGDFSPDGLTLFIDGVNRWKSYGIIKGIKL